jgi:cytochrome c-type biogenesis protein CcmH/NrfG
MKPPTSNSASSFPNPSLPQPTGQILPGGEYSQQFDFLTFDKVKDLDKTQLQSAIAHFENLAAQNAGNIKAWTILGFLYYYLGDASRALMAHQHSSNTNPACQVCHHVILANEL